MSRSGVPLVIGLCRFCVGSRARKKRCCVGWMLCAMFPSICDAAGASSAANLRGRRAAAGGRGWWMQVYARLFFDESSGERGITPDLKL